MSSVLTAKVIILKEETVRALHPAYVSILAQTRNTDQVELFAEGDVANQLANAGVRGAVLRCQLEGHRILDFELSSF
jgi:hypothetical protein